ncbi:MAG: chemotaxis protein CheX [Phycisphaerales bacterium]
MATRSITPFIESVRSVFSMMLQSSVTCTGPFEGSLTQDDPPDVSGVVGMFGDLEGSVVVKFSFETARQVVARFVGSEVSVKSEDFADAIGELVNMITGGAKAKFGEGDVSITVPSVVVGGSHRIHPMPGAEIQSFRCDGELGVFVVEVAVCGPTSSKPSAAGDQIAGANA